MASHSHYSATVKWKIAQFLEVLWWKRYLSGNDPQAYGDWKTNYWKTILEPVKHLLPVSGKALDAGCGPAGIFMILENYEVTAIDPLLDKYISKRLLNTAQFNNIHFQSIALENFEAHQQFDLIFCMNCINHVKDIEKSVQTLSETLNPGGKLVLTIDSHNHTFFRKLFRFIPGDMLHPHQYNLAEYKVMCEKNGFTLLAQNLIRKRAIFNHYLLVFTKA